MTKAPERRLKRMFVRDEDILASLIVRSNQCENYLTFPQLPSDTYIKHIGIDMNSCNIVLFLYSDDFEIIPEGIIIPTIEMRYEVVKNESYMNRKPLL